MVSDLGTIFEGWLSSLRDAGTSFLSKVVLGKTVFLDTTHYDPYLLSFLPIDSFYILPI